MSLKDNSSDSQSQEKEKTADQENGTKMRQKYDEGDAGDGSKREDHYLKGSKLAFALLSIYLMIFLYALDLTIVSTIISEVSNKFDGFDKIGWLISGYMLSMSVFISTWGKLSIIFGRKYAAYVAIVLFEAGSLMCALANTMNVLIGGRVLAGVGAGGIQALSFIIVTETVPMEKRPLAMAGMGAAFAIGSVGGPLLGGVFTTHVTWRWCFYINLPLGGISLLCLYFVYNPPKPVGNWKQKLLKIDYLGVFLLTAGLILSLLAVTLGSGNGYDWNSVAVVCCFVFGGSTLIVFFIWNFKLSKNPIIPYEVVATYQVIAACLTVGGMYGSFMGSYIYLATYFQVIKGKSAWMSGIYLLPIIVPMVSFTVITGVLIKTTRLVKPFIVFSSILFPVSVGITSILETDLSKSKQIGLIILNGAIGGIQFQSGIMGVQLAAPRIAGGAISAITFNNFLRAFLGTIASELANTVFNSSFKNKFKNAVMHLQNKEIKNELAAISASEITTSAKTIESLSPQAQRIVKGLAMGAIKNVFYMCIGFAAISTISSLFITNAKVPEDIKDE
ncbi:uncharacterized protein PRCAT00004318001 [Priceomyces carsonii]|uniref:uncharacterized protein n=1 Tax=Priceomyces carsonii TaxID=28549 RepID=UPI002EDA8152|nr:unnamed protein product [Priceomyces carsonii]